MSLGAKTNVRNKDGKSVGDILYNNVEMKLDKLNEKIRQTIANFEVSKGTNGEKMEKKMYPSLTEGECEIKGDQEVQEIKKRTSDDEQNEDKTENEEGGSFYITY